MRERESEREREREREREKGNERRRGGGVGVRLTLNKWMSLCYCELSQNGSLNPYTEYGVKLYIGVNFIYV